MNSIFNVIFVIISMDQWYGKQKNKNDTFNLFLIRPEYYDHTQYNFLR